MANFFAIYRCDFGFKRNGVDYRFPYVDSDTVDDPQLTHIIRGANSSDDTGIVYSEGNTQPKTRTVILKAIPISVFNMLVEIFRNKERIDYYAIDRVDGSSRISKNAIIQREPRQLANGEDADNINVELIFESFVIEEKMKEVENNG
ncbi:MAG: hypothetical protein LBF97_04630 [Elusimicrobiota bacterium]|jgi:hypothetical protein|nr:hypothetical protein [Elusimicrobiota bacterium]